MPINIRNTTEANSASILTALGLLETHTDATTSNTSLAAIVTAIQGILAVRDIEAQGYIAASSPPSATTAATDTSYTFSSQVNRVIIQNTTSAYVYYAFDATASTGSLVLQPGAFLVYPKKCTVLHLYTVAAQNINAINGIIVLGAL